MTESLADQILHGDDGLLLGNQHGGGRNYVSFGKHRIFDAAAKRVLHQQLLKLQVVLRQNQVLPAGGERAFGTDNLNGRHGADLGLALSIVERLLLVGEGLLLHADIFIGVDEIPVDVFNLIDGGDDLQAEGDVGNFPVVLGNADKASVGQRAEALQQVLCDLELKVGVDLRCYQARRVVGRDVGIVASGGDSSVPLKPLGVSE